MTPDKPSAPADPVGDAIREHIGAAFVTRYVVVASVVEESGEEGTVLLTSPDLPQWMAHGLLSYEAHATIPQPFYDYPDEDEETE